MHSLAGGRGPSRAARRRHITRRRAAAAAIALFIAILAVIAAYALPSQQPASVPAKASTMILGAPARADAQRIVVARLEGVDLLLPVRPESTTAIAFHPVDNTNSVAMSPVGDQMGDNASQKSGEQLTYYLMDGGGTADSSSTSGLDVGGVPGTAVYSPVDGQVTAVRLYELLGRYLDCEIDITVAADPTLRLMVTHIADAKVHVGDQVAAGLTVIGRIRALPRGVQQGISRYTNDAGDHVQLVALRVTPNLAGF
jgi:hypothetical protein